MNAKFGFLNTTNKNNLKTGITRSTTPFMITSGEKEYFYSPAVNHVISDCSQEDADTCFVLHGSKVDSDVAVVFKDADVLILMVRAY